MFPIREQTPVSATDEIAGRPGPLPWVPVVSRLAAYAARMPDGPRGAVLVTGSSTGIGRACVLHLDRLGFTVFAGVRKDADAEALRGAGSERVRPLILDVTEPEQIEAAVHTVTDGSPVGLLGWSTTPGSASAGRSS